MGSINPTVILPGTLQQRLDEVVDQISQSATRTAGQFCTNPGLLLLLDGPESEVFIDRYTARMTTLSARSPILNERVLQGLAARVRDTLSNSQVQSRCGTGIDQYREGYHFSPTVLVVEAAHFRADEGLQREHFGPVTLIVKCSSLDDLLATIESIQGSRVASVFGENDEQALAAELYSALKEKAGRIIWNEVPTGVRVVAAMQHGGPYPATTAPATTSVGTGAITRFMRPVAFQNMPDDLLPAALKASNPLGIWRIINGTYAQN